MSERNRVFMDWAWKQKVAYFKNCPLELAQAIFMAGRRKERYLYKNINNKKKIRK